MFDDFPKTWSGTPWGPCRLAGSLTVLSAEIAAAYPKAIFLGALGDPAHWAEGNASDHNPVVRDPRTGLGIVRAIDIGGPDSMLKEIRAKLWALYDGGDGRLFKFGYAKGCSDNLINNWADAGVPFPGSHVDAGDENHLHVSVTQTVSPSVPSGYVAAIDSTQPWGLVSVVSGDVRKVFDNVFYVYRNPRTNQVSAIGDDWAVDIADKAVEKVWLTQRECLSPSLQTIDATHWDQMMRRVKYHAKSNQSIVDAMKAVNG